MNSKTASKSIVITRGNEPETKVSEELSYSNSKLTETSAICKETLNKLKSSVENLEASTSKDCPDGSSTKSAPSSPDSDSELLKPVFDYNSGRNSSFLQKIPKANNSVKCEVDLSKDDCLNIGTEDSELPKSDFLFNNAQSDCLLPKATSKLAGGRVKDTRGRSVSTEVSSEEPKRKKKRTKEEVEERKREAVVGHRWTQRGVC